MSSGSALPYDPIACGSADDEPPAKRLRMFACARCRRRKQKCDDQRPCWNCQRSGEECHEHTLTAAPTGRLLSSRETQVPPAWVADIIPSLEERVACLERSHMFVDQRRLELDTTNVQENQPHIASQVHPARDHVVQPGEGLAASSAHLEEQVAPQHITRPIHSSEGGQHETVTAATPLQRSSPAIGLLATFARAQDEYGFNGPIQSPVSLRRVSLTKGFTHQHQLENGSADDIHRVPVIDGRAEEALFNIYYNKIHCRYPFLRLEQLRDPVRRPGDRWVGYFLNMIYSIGLLLGKNSEVYIPQEKHHAFHRVAVTCHLGHVFAQPDRILHIQAYLLLAMHALWSPSTERIISIASATMRYCVMAQLHLAEAEPEPVDVAAKIQAQTRRRVFWSAYALDRAVGTMFDLPFSIPDYQITVKMYANIDDASLDAKCHEAFPDDPPSQPSHTTVSGALHVVYCRQIQSEILNTTLHRDFAHQLDRLSNWRLCILEKLQRWKSLCHRYSNSSSSTGKVENMDNEYTKSEWLHMIYNYTLQMLYRPTKSGVGGPAGDWTVKACVQACLIFRLFQKERTMSEAWMALIVQFKSGVALLYCFFATPPHLRSVTYEGPDIPEAIRACSIILSILAERWPHSSLLRDTFDILAREIPITEPNNSNKTSGDDAQIPRRMRKESAEALLASLPKLELIVVHRDTLRMIREMATEDFPRCSASSSTERPVAQASATRTTEAEADGANGHAHENDSASLITTVTGDIFQPIAPHFFLPELSQPGSPHTNFDYMALGFPGIFDEGPFYGQ